MQTSSNFELESVIIVEDMIPRVHAAANMTDEDHSDAESSHEEFVPLLTELRRLRFKWQKKHRQVYEANKRQLKADHSLELDQWKRIVSKLKTSTSREITALKSQVLEMETEIRSLQLQQKQMLDDLAHLFCDICTNEVKSRMTSCGHGFCSACIEATYEHRLSRTTENGAAPLFPCPTCRRDLDRHKDLWPLYLAKAYQSK